jgi:putative transposase
VAATAEPGGFKILKVAIGERLADQLVRDEADLEQHIDYICFNPVKHGHVTCILDWPHTSFHRFVERGLLAPDWGGDLKDIAASFGE